MKKLLAVSIVAALASTQAHAVRLGSDVAENDYRDYIVRFETADSQGRTSTCGGLLVGGEFIVTAAHCVGEYYNPGNVGGDYVSHGYLWELDKGASNAISVFQGVDYVGSKETETTYQVVKFLDRDDTEAAAYAEADQVIADNPTFTWDQDRFFPADWTKGAFFYDIALLKLNTTISQNSHAAITPVFDEATGTWNVQDQDQFVFRGWGRDETGGTPSKMQETTISTDFWNQTWVNGSHYSPATPKQVVDDQACVAGGDNCAYGLFDFLFLFPNTVGGTPDTGDSGTPLEISPNEVFAVAKSAHIGESDGNGGLTPPEWVQFTHLGWYLPSMAKHINKVAAPTSMPFEYEKGQTETVTHTFTIQNLTELDETVNPYVVGGAGVIEVAGCDTTLAPLQACEVTLTINGAAQPASAIMYLGDSRDAQVDISYKEAVANDNNNGGNGGDGSTTPPSISGGGGGGSFGLFSLLTLFGLGVGRRILR